MATLLTCYQRLAIVVLEKALQDAWSGNERLRTDARRFLMEESPLLQFWCRVAGVSSRTVARAALQPPAIQRPYPGSNRAVASAELEDA